MKAGAEGFEPSTKVLETHVLPLHHAPNRNRIIIRNRGDFVKEKIISWRIYKIIPWRIYCVGFIIIRAITGFMSLNEKNGGEALPNAKASGFSFQEKKLPESPPMNVFDG